MLPTHRRSNLGNIYRLQCKFNRTLKIFTVIRLYFWIIICRKKLLTPLIIHRIWRNANALTEHIFCYLVVWLLVTKLNTGAHNANNTGLCFGSVELNRDAKASLLILISSSIFILTLTIRQISDVSFGLIKEVTIQNVAVLPEGTSKKHLSKSSIRAIGGIRKYSVTN